MGRTRRPHRSTPGAPPRPDQGQKPSGQRQPAAGMAAGPKPARDHAIRVLPRRACVSGFRTQRGAVPFFCVRTMWAWPYVPRFRFAWKPVFVGIAIRLAQACLLMSLRGPQAKRGGTKQPGSSRRTDRPNTRSNEVCSLTPLLAMTWLGWACLRRPDGDVRGTAGTTGKRDMARAILPVGPNNVGDVARVLAAERFGVLRLLRRALRLPLCCLSDPHAPPRGTLPSLFQTPAENGLIRRGFVRVRKERQYIGLPYRPQLGVRL